MSAQVASRASVTFPHELEADHARHEHGDRLAEHGGLGLDAADVLAQVKGVKAALPHLNAMVRYAPAYPLSHLPGLL